ncbi:hypothetical protein HPB50_018846 [Hyalomma asiaticum]|uniref:Uncharacterized protein n=1 Tax=Hyalomma asiaticum TaxID=266040 RepID=A0ACB7SMQ2_HYAAI|nr:hypothetical protein HPB50_018846 [Hyalomma asiaticum]
MHYSLGNRTWLHDDGTEEWQSWRSPDFAKRSFVIGLVPVVCFSVVWGTFLLNHEWSRDFTNMETADTLPSLRELQPVSAINQPSGVATVLRSTPARAAHAVIHTPFGRYEGTVCTSFLCRFVAHWLRTKLDTRVDPCQDFYSYVCGTFEGLDQFTNSFQLMLRGTYGYCASQTSPGETTAQAGRRSMPFESLPQHTPPTESASQETDFVAKSSRSVPGLRTFRQVEQKRGDLVEWMISLNLDLANEAKLATVNAADMIVRSSVEFGIDALFSITFDEKSFHNSKRIILIAYSEEQEDWQEKRGIFPQRTNEVYYAELLQSFVNNPPRQRELATKLIKYEMQRDWVKYTYTGGELMAYQYYVVDILLDALENKFIGIQGLRYLIAWSVFRQMVIYTVPSLLMSRKSDRFVIAPTVDDVCYDHVLKAMKLVSLVSPFLQSTLFPDVPTNRFFIPWKTALSLSRQKTWTDQTTWLYDESALNAQYFHHLNSVIIPTPRCNDHSSFTAVVRLSTTAVLELTVVTFQIKRVARQDVADDTLDSENMADVVGIVATYSAYESLPSIDRKKTLLGLNITAERLFFINNCVKYCAHHSQTEGVRHSPFRSRCMVPPMNMPEFAAAFGCAPGTPMNPHRKCTFWS